MILARVCATSLSSSYSPSSPSGDHPGTAEEIFDSRSLASTLEKLYVWEKKLYKEVKVCLWYLSHSSLIIMVVSHCFATVFDNYVSLPDKVLGVSELGQVEKTEII